MRTISLDDACARFGEDLANSKDVFFWDCRAYHCLGNDFFTRLDNKLRPVGLEVVEIEFDGDALPWFVGELTNPHDSRMMMLGLGNWCVRETECYPNKYKVVPAVGNMARETNDTCNFFPTREAAQEEADKRSHK
jgi:hypothetical protein